MDNGYLTDDDFERLFAYESYRPSDVDELKSLAKSFFYSENLKIEYRISSLVVFVYKCIEARDVGGAQEAWAYGDELINILKDTSPINKKGVREDPAQVALSYYTAMWHASVFLKDSPVRYLEKIREMVNGTNLIKASYAQNVGRALLLLSYVYFVNGSEDKARSVIYDFYKYFVSLFSFLNPASPVGSSHFGDVAKCTNALQCALAGLEWIDKKRYRKNLWNTGRIFNLTSRVDEVGFKKKFLGFFSSANDGEKQQGTVTKPGASRGFTFKWDDADNLITYFHHEDLSKGEVGGETALLFNSVFNAVANEGLKKEFLEQSLRCGFIKLNFDDVEYICNRSIVVNQQNYLIFSSLSGFDFILGQRHLFVSEIIIPEKRAVLKIDRARSQADDVIKKWYEGELGAGGHFSGVLLSYGRPYHYFYDLLPAFKSSSEAIRSAMQNSATEFLPLVIVKDKSFLPPELYSEHGFKTFEYKDESELNADGGFCLKLGYVSNGQQSRVSSKGGSWLVVDEFDAFLEDRISCYFNEDPLEIPPSDFNIWLGVCSEKRTWKEQKKGLRLILDELDKKGLNVNVFVDGMTRPFYVDKHSFSEDFVVKRELDLYLDIFGSFFGRQNFNFFNLIGEGAPLKIWVSKRIDFFVTGFLTDSMYPARFGGSHGVGHGSYAARVSDHKHPNTIFIKSSKSRDEAVIKNKGTNWPRQSYSIRSGDVARLVMEEISNTERG